MRHLTVFLLIWALSMCSSVAQSVLPDCATSCYGASHSSQVPCMFGNNDCTCMNSAASAAAQSCILQSCTVKEWLVTINATDTICQRSVRNESNVVFCCVTTLGSAALLAIIMRLFVAMRQNTFGYDDLFACLAACMSVSSSIGLALSAKLGLGRDIWTLKPHEINRIHKITYVCQNLYFWCSGFQKLCFLFFFLRIFPSENARRWCLVGIALAIGYSVGFGLTMTFSCWPISAIWTRWAMEKTPVYCINLKLFYYIAAAVNISSDLLIALIPIPQLWRLNLSLRRKLYLLAVFGVGFIIIAVSCMRIQTLAQYSTTRNTTYDTISRDMWSNIEINVGVICICMPAIRRFLAHTLPQCFASTEDTMSLHGEAQTLDYREPSGKTSSKKRRTLSDSLFVTTIMKTVDIRVSSNRPEDDEAQLVELGAR
ncbi:uncharacterized protein EKO05_0001833 [Ascochyta rabiei]|uniref:uncharacterized protein n=1 Tax=Didymella rabiei TaxID=5454 RepID=UPI00220EAE52|nr:uncharacterized protein EKO05_0001833 [Ascochyta rabiei]UPX11213.1 hypothetical protein EKO05_0001833 [Ascochyta rabiei]